MSTRRHRNPFHIRRRTYSPASRSTMYALAATAFMCASLSNIIRRAEASSDHSRYIHSPSSMLPSVEFAGVLTYVLMQPPPSSRSQPVGFNLYSVQAICVTALGGFVAQRHRKLMQKHRHWCTKLRRDDGYNGHGRRDSPVR